MAWRRNNLFGAVLATAVACVGSRANAALEAQTIARSNGEFVYAIAFSRTTNGDMLKPGDSLTFYDVGVVGCDLGPANAPFTFTQANVGPTPDTVLPTDSPLVANATLTYTGPVATSSIMFYVGFVADIDSSRVGQYVSVQSGLVQAGVSRPVVTIASALTPIGTTAVPEPGVLGAGMGVVAVLRRRRRS